MLEDRKNYEFESKELYANLKALYFLGNRFLICHSLYKICTDL